MPSTPRQVRCRIERTLTHLDFDDIDENLNRFSALKNSVIGSVYILQLRVDWVVDLKEP
jgi:hypothetical protein